MIKQILKLRGYKNIKNDGDEIVFKRGDGKKGRVVFINKPKANIDDLTSILREYVENPIHIIIVYHTMTAPSLKSFNDNIRHYFKDSELIKHSNLIKNPLDNRLTPTGYKKLTPLEKKILLKGYNTTADKFPTMLPTDIMAILLGFKEGDIVEITSHYNFTKKQVDMDMPPQITYRHVTEVC